MMTRAAFRNAHGIRSVSSSDCRITSPPKANDGDAGSPRSGTSASSVTARSRVSPACSCSDVAAGDMWIAPPDPVALTANVRDVVELFVIEIVALVVHRAAVRSARPKLRCVVEAHVDDPSERPASTTPAPHS